MRIRWTRPRRGLIAIVGVVAIGCSGNDASTAAAPPTSVAAAVAGRPAGSSLVPVPDADVDCTPPVATGEITGRAQDFFVVTDLAGTVTNESNGSIHVTAIDFDFEPGIPKGVKTASLTVEVDLTIAPGAAADWTWTGQLTVRPFHDDAPQPVAKRVTWTWPAPGHLTVCPPAD